MSTWSGPVLALVLGWAGWRWLHRLPGSPPPAVLIPLLGVGGVGAWVLLLESVGLPATPLTQGVPVVLFAAASLAAPRSNTTTAGRPGVWAIAATCAAIPSAILAAGRPAAGWDFRYLWGLKAAVFAGAGHHDPSWLAWPAHAFAHPDYPPMWSDLIATSIRFGADPAAAAAAWQAPLVFALAASCWHAARGAPAGLRAAAAAAGAWAPVVTLPVHGGYAEPLLAFLVAAALASLPAMLRGETGGVLAAAAATAALALTKNEGMALAAGVALAATISGARRRAWPVGAAFVVAVLAWRTFMWSHGIEGEAIAIDGGRIAPRLPDAPAAVAQVLSLPLVLIALAWALVIVALALCAAPATLAIPAVWLVAAVLVYLTTPNDLAWHLRWSLDRVLAAPLPGFIALALGSAWSPHRAAPPAPGKRPGAAPSA